MDQRAQVSHDSRHPGSRVAAPPSPPHGGAPRNGLRPLLAIVVLSLIWGVTWVLSKQALAYSPPFAFAAERCTGGALALLLVSRLMGRSMRLVAPGRTSAIALTQVAGFMILQTCALVVNGPGKTSVLIFMMPIWTLLLAGMLLGERVRGLQWVAAASTLAGLLLVIAPWNLHGSAIGDLLGVGAALCWAIGTVLVKHLRAEHSVDLIALTTWQMLISAVPLTVLALLVPERATDWSVHYLVLLAVVSLISTSLGWWLWIYVLDHVPAWEASLSVLGTPVVAIVSSTLLLGERFVPSEVAGMLLIAAGLAFLSLVGYLNRPRV